MKISDDFKKNLLKVVIPIATIVAISVVGLGINKIINSDIGIFKSKETKLDDFKKEIALINVNANEEKIGQFVLVGVKKYSLEYLKENITITPESKFEIEKKEGDNDSLIITLLENQNEEHVLLLNIIDSKNSFSDFKTMKLIPQILKVSSFTRVLIERNIAITLTFSSEIDIESFKANFSISPEIEVNIEYKKFKVLITPAGDVGWINGSIYEVFLKKGIKGVNSHKLNEDVSFTYEVNLDGIDAENQTRAKKSIRLIKNNFDTNVPVDGEEKFIVHAGQSLRLGILYEKEKKKNINYEETVPAEIVVYKIGDIDKYINEVDIYLKKDFSLDNLTKVETRAILLKEGENEIDFLIQKEGGYIAFIRYIEPTNDEQTQWLLPFIVTPYNVYMESTKLETAVWINNIENKTIPSNITVEFLEEGEVVSTAKTDAQGLVVFDNRERTYADTVNAPILSDDNHYYDAEQSHIRLKDSSGKIVFDDNTKIRREYAKERDRYYSYFYLDRPIYKPTDTISFWGFIKPYEYGDTKEMPSQIVVHFDEEGGGEKQIVDVSPSGIYHGEIKLESILSTQYNISVYIEKEVDKEPIKTTLDNKYIEVKNYVKPKFKIETFTENNLYFMGDEVEIEMTAMFYDGTPLSYYEVEYAVYNQKDYSWTQNKKITTDKDGKASVKVKVNDYLSYDINNYADSQSVKFEINTDGEIIGHVKTFFVFNTETATEVLMKRKDENIEVTAKTYEVDFSSKELRKYFKDLEGEAYDTWFYSYYYINEDDLLKYAKGKLIDVKYNATINWKYVDTESVTHTNYYWYHYIYDKDLRSDKYNQEKTASARSIDGVYTIDNVINIPDSRKIDFEKDVFIEISLNYSPKLDRNKYRSYYFTLKDGEVANDDYYKTLGPGEAVAKGLHLKVFDVEANEYLLMDNSYYSSNYATNNSFEVNKKYRVDVFYDDKKIDASSKLFYSLNHDKMIEHKIVTGNSFEIVGDPKYASTLLISVAYFTGVQTEYVDQLNINFNRDSVELDIQVIADKDAYMPGDKVSLAFDVKDKKGIPVAGNMLVSIVDESIFALQEQNIDVLYGLYGSMYFSNWSVPRYCSSYRNGRKMSKSDYALSDSGGKGGDGAEFYNSYRSNFKDTALFIPTTTNASGKANISFTLPDNTTSWRVSVLEITDKLYAGFKKENIISTMPFYTSPVVLDTYLLGDDVALNIQGHGVALDKDSEISYTAEIIGDDFEKIVEGKAKAYNSVFMNFGKLEEGEYILKAKSQFKGYVDTVELPIRVIKNNLELVVNKEIDINNIDISAVRYPVTIQLYDEKSEAYVKTLSSMLGHYCMHASQRMSRFVAKKAIIDSASDINLLPKYITKGNDSLSDMQNLDGGINYYPGTESNVDITCYSLVIDKTQYNLVKAREYLERQESGAASIDVQAMIYMGLAATGKDMIKESEELLKTVTSRQSKSYLIAAIFLSGDEKTARKHFDDHLLKFVGSSSTFYGSDDQYIWIPASLLKHESANEIALKVDRGWRYSALYESMIYLVNFNQKVEVANFSYETLGEVHNESVGLTGFKTLSFHKSEFESLKIISMPKSIKAQAYYIGEPEEFGTKQSSNINVEKTLEKIDETTYEITVNFKFTKNAPLGVYDVSDHVPSNTRLYKIMQTDGYRYNSKDKYRESYSAFDENQKIYYSLYLSEYEASRNRSYKYIVKKVNDSEAVLDSTYIIHGESGENAKTEKSVFDPK